MIETGWHIHASVNYVNISEQCQGIILSDAGLLSIGA